MSEGLEKKLDDILKQIELANAKLEALEQRIERIEDDIYEDDVDLDEDDEEEILINCPYCHYDFTLDEEDINFDEIKCPNCGKTIEIDWEGSSFGGGCPASGCSSCPGCNIPPRKDEKNDNEDDM